MPKTKSTIELPPPSAFKDDLGRDAMYVSLLRGGRCPIPTEDYERISKRPDFTPNWRENNDRGSKREGMPLPYVRFCRTNGKHAHRAIVEERLRAQGVRFPKGFEVACVSQDRRNLMPENWKLRPRGDNKYWRKACEVFAPGFDFATGFDLPVGFEEALIQETAMFEEVSARLSRALALVEVANGYDDDHEAWEPAIAELKQLEADLRQRRSAIISLYDMLR